MVFNADKAFLAITLAVSITEKEKRKRRWCKEWYKMRYRFTHEHLQRTLKATEPDDYKNFLRMDNDSFETLLELIRPNIEKQDTNMRQAIPASQRLSICKVLGHWYGLGRFKVYVCCRSSYFGFNNTGDV